MCVCVLAYFDCVVAVCYLAERERGGEKELLAYSDCVVAVCYLAEEERERAACLI